MDLDKKKTVNFRRHFQSSPKVSPSAIDALFYREITSPQYHSTPILHRPNRTFTEKNLPFVSPLNVYSAVILTFDVQRSCSNMLYFLPVHSSNNTFSGQL